MRRLGNVSLSIKLTLFIFTVLGIFLISNIILLVNNTRNFTEAVGNERIQEVSAEIQNKLDSIQQTIRADVTSIANDILFFQAVGRRNVSDISNMIANTNRHIFE